MLLFPERLIYKTRLEMHKKIKVNDSKKENQARYTLLGSYIAKTKIVNKVRMNWFSKR